MTTTRIQQLNEMRAIAGMPPLSKKQEAVINEARMPQYDPRTRSGYDPHTDTVGVFCSSNEEAYSYFVKNKTAVNQLADFLGLNSRGTQQDVANALRNDAAQGGDSHVIQPSQLDQYLSDFREFALRSIIDDQEKQEFNNDFDLNVRKLKQFIQRIGPNSTLYCVNIDYTNSIVVLS